MPFSKAKADQAVAFYQLLKHSKGRWAGKPFILQPQQEAEVRKIFGTVRKDGLRQYRTVYKEVPRKNGKSMEAAATALFLLFADDEPGAEIYSAAGDRDQASIVFDIAAYMVEHNEYLSSRCKISHNMKRITVHSTNSFYRAISAEAYTKHGFNAHGIIFDELHTQPNRELWDVLNTSTGAREQPLTFAITTAGYDRQSICWEVHDYACKVRDGIIDDPTFLPIIYAADDKKDDWKSPTTWRKANPNLNISISEEYLAKECKRAQQVPAYENTFKRLHLNIWTQQATRWMAMDAWDECNFEDLSREALKGLLCYGAFDLASKNDIAAKLLLFPPQDWLEHYLIVPTFYVPEDNIKRYASRNAAPYDAWIKQGYLVATPGNVIDYGRIQADIERDATDFNLREIAYDDWDATKLVRDLQNAGFDRLIAMRQGFKSMSAPTKELMNFTLSKKLNHQGHPVLRWMASNMVVKVDPAGNLKPDKEKAGNKIDGMVALIMALDRVIRHENEERSIYNEQELMIL